MLAVRSPMSFNVNGLRAESEYDGRSGRFAARGPGLLGSIAPRYAGRDQGAGRLRRPCERRHGSPAGRDSPQRRRRRAVGAPAVLDADALRTAVASAVARAPRRPPPRPWSIDASPRARAGRAGAGDRRGRGLRRLRRRALQARATREADELIARARRAGDELRELIERAGGRRAPSRRGARPRQPAAERPHAGRARRVRAGRSRSLTSRVETHGRAWIEEQGMGAFAAVACGERRTSRS